MTYATTFSGIGGWELGLNACGWNLQWQCESDPFCRALLNERFGVPIYDDIRTICEQSPPSVDALIGSPPCQPFSVAGAKRGTSDERHLYPAFIELVRHLKPRWVLMEQVPNIFSIDGGRAFGGYLAGLAALGFDIVWHCIPACAVGANHRRDRIWVIANARGIQYESGCAPNERQGAAQLSLANSRRAGFKRGRVGGGKEEINEMGDLRFANGSEATPNAIIERLERIKQRRPAAWAAHGPGNVCDPGWWSTEPDIRGMVDGISEGLHKTIYASSIQSAEENRTPSLETCLRGVRWLVTAWLASQGRKSQEQRFIKLTNALRSLPHQASLGIGETALEDSQSFLFHLRQACEAIGALRDTQVATIEAWQSLAEEDQGWVILATCGGRWIDEWPSVTRTATAIPFRSHRLKGLGNAVIPQIPFLIGQAINEIEGPE